MTIATAYQNGSTLIALAAEWGCNLVTIRNVLLRRGVARKPRGGILIELSETQRREALDQWNAGQSKEVIAASLSISTKTLTRVLRFMGVSQRPNRGNFRGGRLHSNGGYIFVAVTPDSPFASMRSSNGYVLEHRLVMAQKLGRPLLATETVHHINGDQQDNRPENLQLRQAKHGKHEAWRCLDCGSTNIAAMPLEGS